VAEAAVSAVPRGMVKTVCSALAPTWEELAQHGLTDPARSWPRHNDIDQLDADATGQFLRGALAQTVAAFGEGYGLILRHPHRSDPASAELVTRLIREARPTGFHIAVEGSRRLLLDARFGQDLADGQYVALPTRDKAETADVADPATRIVAVCPQGLPLDLLARLAPSPYSGAVKVTTGPMDLRLAYLPFTTRKLVLSRMTPSDRRQIAQMVFDAWDPAGWGYIRRAGYAVAANDLDRMLAQHTSYSYGLRATGRRFLYRQFRALTLHPELESFPRPWALEINIGAARLASSLFPSFSPRTVVHHYLDGLTCCGDTTTQAALTCELANVYARQRHHAALIKSRRWYGRVASMIDSLPEGEDRLQLEIRRANGLALVEYHEQRNREALALEQNARLLTQVAARDYPNVAAWAGPLINTNLAKLLKTRFSDVDTAQQLLEENLGATEPEQRARARLDLAAIHFDRKEYSRVTELLMETVDTEAIGAFDTETELFARAMLAISFVLLGNEREAAYQLERVSHLGALSGSEGARGLVARLTQPALSDAPRQSAMSA